MPNEWFARGGGKDGGELPFLAPESSALVSASESVSRNLGNFDPDTHADADAAGSLSPFDSPDIGLRVRPAVKGLSASFHVNIAARKRRAS